MDQFPFDLSSAVAAIVDGRNVCRLVALSDVESELPARTLTEDERTSFFKALTEAGIELITNKI